MLEKLASLRRHLHDSYSNYIHPARRDFLLLRAVQRPYYRLAEERDLLTAISIDMIPKRKPELYRGEVQLEQFYVLRGIASIKMWFGLEAICGQYLGRSQYLRPTRFPCLFIWAHRGKVWVISSGRPA